MEEVAAVRRAASDATADVVPEELRETIDDHVDAGSTVPGVLTILSAGATGDDLDAIAERAAGVQLIYEGLRLTRTLVQSDPWTSGNRDDADMDILAADVLVARGFYLLARTEAAEAAVGVVRSFGRDQTERETDDRPESFDRNLEADVLELALIAGSTASGGHPVDAARIAADIAPEDHPFQAADHFFDGVDGTIGALALDGGRPLNRND